MTPTQARQSLARSLKASGQTVVLQRLSGAGAGTYRVKARVMGAEPSDVVGAVQQLRRKAIVSAEEVESTGFPVPFLPRQDRVIWNGKTLVITAVNDATRRFQGVLIAYELELAGA